MKCLLIILLVISFLYETLSSKLKSKQDEDTTDSGEVYEKEIYYRWKYPSSLYDTKQRKFHFCKVQMMMISALKALKIILLVLTILQII